jgi:hypothetical protein
VGLSQRASLPIQAKCRLQAGTTYPWVLFCVLLGLLSKGVQFVFKVAEVCKMLGPMLKSFTVILYGF